MGFLARLAKFAYRDTNDSGPALSTKTKLIAGLVVFCALFGTLAVGLTVEIGSWSKVGPAVGIPKHDWHVLFRDAVPAEQCDELGARNYTCLASPDNPTLWKSPHLRSDASHQASVDEMKGRTYWLGATIPSARLLDAYNAGANHLVLGFIVAHYEVWIDGARYITGNYDDMWIATVIPLPLQRLTRPRDMRIAVKVTHDLGAVYPDAMALDVEEGLATAEQAQTYMRKNIYQDSVRPWFFFAINFILATLLFVVWHSNPRRQEYFYMSFYALIHAWQQTLATDLDVWHRFGVGNWHRINTIATAYAAGAALFVGLSFARARRSFFRRGVPFFAIAPLVAQFFVADGRDILDLTGFIESWLTPLCYALGAASCFLQAGFGPRGVRASRLTLFGVGLLGIGLSFIYESGSVTSATEYVYWHHFLSVALTLFLAGVVMYEYREQEKLIEKTPVSPFHKRAVLPESVSGVLLAVDLKHSEELFRLGSERGHAGLLVHTALSHLWSVVAKHGGIMLQTEGDMLRALFESESGEGAKALKLAVAASLEMQEKLDEYAEQLKLEGTLPARHPGLFFRASLSSGQIKPIWQESDKIRYAAWIESGSTNAFVESARLLELERQLSEDEPNVSIVTLPVDLAKGLRIEHWVTKDTTLAAKHGRIYRVAAYATRAREKAVAA